MRKLTVVICLVLGCIFLVSPVKAAGHSTLHFGDSGYEVKQVQFILTSFSYILPIDGVYGTKTVKAVKHFQEASGLFADGVTGPQTWKVFDRYIVDIPVVEKIPGGQPNESGPSAARSALKAAGVDPETIEWAIKICERESHCSLIHVYRSSTHDDSWGPWMINYWGLDARSLTIGPRESNVSSWASAVANFLKLYRATGRCPWIPPNYCA